MLELLASGALGVICVIGAVTTINSRRLREQKRRAGFGTIGDNFKTLAEVQVALRKVGLEASQLIIGVDFTRSNETNGAISFDGRCLHDILPDRYNPYQTVIDIMGRTLEPFDADHQIPVYGFGDIVTADRAVFSFNPDERPCFGIAEVLARYNEILPTVQLSGPTTFAPLIRKAIEIVKRENQYHILLILSDGQVENVRETAAAIVEASHYPLSIIAVGIGDADFSVMHEFDDELPERQFDNFQFVEFSEIVNNRRVENADVAFAVAALQEIPEQYKCIKRLKML